jgi:hypothetical protein
MIQPRNRPSTSGNTEKIDENTYLYTMYPDQEFLKNAKYPVVMILLIIPRRAELTTPRLNMVLQEIIPGTQT